MSAFIRERCKRGANMSVAVDDLWNAWKIWCEADNRGTGTKAIFGRDLRAALPTIKKSRLRDGDERHHEYLGLGLRGD